VLKAKASSLHYCSAQGLLGLKRSAADRPACCVCPTGPRPPLPCCAAKVAAQNIVLLDAGKELQRYPECEGQCC